MVKNGATSIRETIDAIKDYIGYYVILDTGSTDNTIEIMRDALQTKNGKIFEEPFKGFDVSRNRLIELAENENHNCKHFIMLDDTYIVKNPDKLISYLEKNYKKPNLSYLMTIVTKNVDVKESVYYNTRIWKTNSGLRYKDPIHEYIDTNSSDIIPHNISHLFDNVNQYMKVRSIKRRDYDISILKEMHEKDPKYVRALRYLIVYLYNNATKEECLEYCIKLVTLLYTEKPSFYNGTEQNDFYNGCVKLIKLLVIMFDKKLEDVLEYIKLAHTVDPDQVEHVYYHACLLEREHKYEEMKYVLERIYGVKPPTDPKKIANIRINKRMYDIEIPYKYIMSLIFTKDYKKARRCVLDVLEKFPNNIVFLNILDNLNTKIDEYTVTKYEEKVLVVSLNNPDNIEKVKFYIETLKSRGWKIYIFTDIELEIENVIIQKQNEFYKFIKDTFVDVLISFNTTSFAVYLENVKKVYVWNCENNELPESDIFMSHPNYFKGFICQSSYMKNKLVKNYALDEKLVKQMIIPSDNIQVQEKVKNKITVFYKYETAKEYKFVDNVLKMLPDIQVDVICFDSIVEKNHDYTYIPSDDIEKIKNSIATSEYYLSILNENDTMISTAMMVNTIPICCHEEYKNFSVLANEKQQEKIAGKITLLMNNEILRNTMLSKIEKQKENYTMKAFCKELTRELLN